MAAVNGVVKASQNGKGPVEGQKGPQALAPEVGARAESRKAEREIMADAAGRAGGEEKRGPNPMMWVRDPLYFYGTSKKLRKRPGWHQTWCRNDQFEEMMSMGYRQIRAPKGEEKAGEETGEVLKIKETDERTLIAVEIPEDVYQEHLKAVAYRSHIRYSSDVKETLRDHIRGVNKDYGTKKEVLRVVSEGEEPAERIERRSERLSREGHGEDEE